MGFRLIWLETDHDNQPGFVSEFSFPIGSEYESQKIYFSKSVHPSCTVSQDKFGNKSLSLDKPIVIHSDMPLLLGFVASIDLYRDAYVIPNPHASSHRDSNSVHPQIESFLQDDLEYDLNNLKFARLETATLLQQICASSDMGSAENLSQVKRLPIASQPVLYWVLSASRNNSVGQEAAAKLVELCNRSGGRLKIEQFLEYSPSRIWTRLIKNTALKNGLVTFKGHQYRFFDQKVSWSEAKTRCELLGGHLVTISDTQEQNFIAQLPPILDRDNRVWIGLADRELQGQWEWVTGESLVFENWAPGLPDNLTGNQDCVEMGYANSKWNDKSGRNRFAFICEWE